MIFVGNSEVAAGGFVQVHKECIYKSDTADVHCAKELPVGEIRAN